MDLVKSIQSTLHERVVSPLAGVFLISWGVMHYDLIMMLMSKNDMAFKVNLVNQHLVIEAINDWGDLGWPWLAPYFYGLLLPIIISFTALLSYSSLSIPAFWIVTFSKVTLKNIKITKEGQILISRNKHEEICNSYKKKINDLLDGELKADAAMERMKRLHQNSMDQIKNLEDRIDKDSDEIDEAPFEIDSQKSDIPKLPDDVIAKYSEVFSNNVDDKESGGYVWLICDSKNAILNRKILLLTQSIGDSDYRPLSIKEVLFELRMPSHDVNKAVVEKACKMLEEYHLFQNEFGKYQVTNAGVEMIKNLKGDVDAIRTYCASIDEISNI